MAVSIRLTRKGKKKRPVYRIVVSDKSKPRDGSALENLGFYDPNNVETKFTIHKDRVEYWLSVGAQPTKTVKRFLAEEGILKKYKVVSSNQKVKKKDRKKEAESE